MGVLEHSVWINADPEQVWSVYADPCRIPDWQTGRPVIVDLHGRWDEPGASYISKHGPLSAHTTVLLADRPHRLVTRTDAYLGLRFHVTSRLGRPKLAAPNSTFAPRRIGPMVSGCSGGWWNERSSTLVKSKRSSGT
jgi:hypothetical protein